MSECQSVISPTLPTVQLQFYLYRYRGVQLYLYRYPVLLEALAPVKVYYVDQHKTQYRYKYSRRRGWLLYVPYTVMYNKVITEYVSELNNDNNLFTHFCCIFYVYSHPNLACVSSIFVMQATMHYQTVESSISNVPVKTVSTSATRDF